MPHDLKTHPIHLGTGATAIVQPPFTGSDWYAGYGARHDDDGREGRLVSMHTFREPWSVWEMHPEGQEVVLCVEGTITLIQEIDGNPVRTTLEPGQYAINPQGVWHTADVEKQATAVFITAGIGTQDRER